MTAIISGNDLGLSNIPLTPLGGAAIGRGAQSDQVDDESAIVVFSLTP